MWHLNELSVFAFECGHLRTADEGCLGQNFPPARSDLLGHSRMLSAQVDKRNRVHFSPFRLAILSDSTAQ